MRSQEMIEDQNKLASKEFKKNYMETDISDDRLFIRQEEQILAISLEEAEFISGGARGEKYLLDKEFVKSTVAGLTALGTAALAYNITSSIRHDGKGFDLRKLKGNTNDNSGNSSG